MNVLPLTLVILNETRYVIFSMIILAVFRSQHSPEDWVLKFSMYICFLVSEMGFHTRIGKMEVLYKF
jgi:hypothetical protein